jgi:hypothetical protein
MTTFRIHFASGDKFDVDAETPAEAGKKALAIRSEVIVKIKQVKEQPEFQTKLDIAGRI